jgi:hypothetical protein
MAQTTVTIRGKPYKVVKRESISHLGQKYFGQFKTILEDGQGNRYKHVGKKIGPNANISAM